MDKTKQNEIDKMYFYIIPMLKNICANYPFIEMDDEFITTFLLDKINKNINRIKNIDNFANFVIKRFEQKVKASIKERLEDDNSYMNIINGFIKHNLRTVKNITDSLTFFEKLLDLFLDVDCLLTDEDIKELISSHEKLKRSLKKIYQEYGKMSKKYIVNELTIRFLEIYCMMNELYLADIQEDEVEESFDDELEYDISGFDSVTDFYSEDLFREIIVKASQKPLLTDREQKELLKSYAEGNQNALDILIERNTRLVISIVKRYAGRGIDLLDLYQEGIVGLMKAIQKFNLSKQTSLSTYAVWWIRQAIKRYIDNQGRAIRIPVHESEKLAKLMAIKNKLLIELDREPTVVELAEKMRLSVEKILELLSIQEPLSLNAKIDDEKDEELEYFQMSSTENTEERIIKEDTIARLRFIIDTMLPEQEKKVIILRFGINGGGQKSLEEVGTILGYTRERIRQLERNAFKIFKSPKASELIKESLNTPSIFIKDINAKSYSVTNNKNTRTLYDYFPTYSKILIDTIIPKLSEEDILLLQLRFGKDYLSSEEKENWNFQDNKKIKLIFVKMQQIIDMEMQALPKMVNGLKTIYYYFDGYSKDEIEAAIDQLSDKDRNLIINVFGKDFITPINDDDKVKNNFYQIRYKLIRFLNGDTTTIYHSFKNYTQIQVDSVIANLSEKEQALIALRYGLNLSRPKKMVGWKPEYIKDLGNLKKKIAKILSERFPKTIEIIDEDGITIERQLQVYETPEVKIYYSGIESMNEEEIDVNNPVLFSYILNSMPRLLVTILELKYGIGDRCYTNEEIANIMNYSEVEVIELVKKALACYKEIFSSLIQEVIRSSKYTDATLKLEKK